MSVRRSVTYDRSGQPRERVEVAATGKHIPRRYQLIAEPAPDDDQPGTVMSFEVIDGVPQCREITFKSTEHGRGIRRRDLIQPVEDLIEYATKIVALFTDEEFVQDDRVINIDELLDPSFIKSVRHARRTDRRRGPSDEELQLAADIYRSADRAPTKAVGEHFELAPRTASLWVSRAREKGYLK